MQVHSKGHFYEFILDSYNFKTLTNFLKKNIDFVMFFQLCTDIYTYLCTYLGVHITKKYPIHSCVGGFKVCSCLAIMK